MNTSYLILKRYSTGRKHCSRCKHWRHLVDFSVDKWFDVQKTIPHYLCSACMLCRKVQNRSASRKYYLAKHGDDFSLIFNARHLSIYLDSKIFITEDGEYLLNGIRISDTEAHQLARWRRGEVIRASYESVDQWAHKFGLSMWEMEEVAKIAV